MAPAEARLVRVGYVIYNERPASGLVRTQVISLLREIRRQSPSTSITLVCFWQPWVAIKWRIEISEMRKALAAAEIRVRSYPIAIIPSRHFLYKKNLFPILRSWGLLLFTIAFVRDAFDIVHSRSYFASMLTAQLKRWFGYRCIFDMRSLWPKEHVTVGAWSTEDDIYQMWRELERRTIERSDATVGVTDGIVEEAGILVPDAMTALIPICADLNVMHFDGAAREEIREKYKWGHRKVIVYQGSLGLLNRNIINVAEHMAFIRAADPSTFVLVVTSGNADSVAEAFARVGIPRSETLITSASGADLRRWLSAADVGIHVMSAGPDSRTRLGVKVVEYLSCGLPIIVNSNVGAAAELVLTHDVGAVLDLGDDDKRAQSSSAIHKLLTNAPSMRTRCRKVAEDLFAVEECARQYVNLYERVQRKERAS